MTDDIKIPKKITFQRGADADLGWVREDAYLAGYESPIMRYVKDTARQIEDEESGTLMEIVHGYGFHVDRDELMKALKYDRDQYAAGYAAGLAEGSRRPLQKPLTLEEVKALDEEEEVYIEKVCSIGFRKGHVILEHYIMEEEAQFCGDETKYYLPHRKHGKEWRCWDHKPSEEERKAATWEGGEV